jgi:hypothetical protein
MTPRAKLPGCSTLTVTAGVQIQDIADPHVDDSEKALVLLLELLLIEYLYG